jgi:heat shock protein HslJ
VLEVRFMLGRVSGRVACNSFWGSYRIVDEKLEAALAQTTAGCRRLVPDEFENAMMIAFAALVSQAESGRLPKTG